MLVLVLFGGHDDAQRLSPSLRATPCALSAHPFPAAASPRAQRTHPHFHPTSASGTLEFEGRRGAFSHPAGASPRAPRAVPHRPPFPTAPPTENPRACGQSPPPPTENAPLFVPANARPARGPLPHSRPPYI